MREGAAMRAAERAGAAEERIRVERMMLEVEQPGSRLRRVLERSIKVHQRAAAVQASAVTLFLRHEEMRRYSRRHEQADTPRPTRTVRDAELR